MLAAQVLKRLSKKTKKGFRGYPMATIAFYGPDDKHASKVAVGIILGSGESASEMRRWTCEAGDIRRDLPVLKEVIEFLEASNAKSVAMVDRIIGCPHEEGVDYEGETCPMCPFWIDRDRWTGAKLPNPDGR
jgi:hypothetical protein